MNVEIQPFWLNYLKQVRFLKVFTLFNNFAFKFWSSNSLVHIHNSKNFAQWLKNVLNQSCFCIGHIKAVHLKIKDHPCDKCSLAFIDERKLACHVKEVHLGIKPHQCTQCNKAFSRRATLMVHVESVHEKSMRYPCNLCKKKFRRIEGLRRHLRKLHSADLLDISSTEDSYKKTEKVQKVVAKRKAGKEVEMEP